MTYKLLKIFIKYSLPVLLIMCISTRLSAQNDTVYGYLNKHVYKCAKEAAVYYSKLYKDGNLWRKASFCIANGRLKYSSSFTDKDCKKLEGDYLEYSDSGQLFKASTYINGKLQEATYYFENGNKAGYAAYDTATNNIVKQEGWDENGKNIKDYIFFKAAEFPGKSEGWVKFLQKNLNANIPVTNKASTGRYTVLLGFFVEIDGTLSDITVLSDPGFGTGAEALRVMHLTKNWLTGIENNKPARIMFKQPITFMVSD